MPKNLVIVESPAKAKTIEKFLGSDFKVMSSFGHIRDLKKKNFGVDLDTFRPEYEIPADKVHVVSELRAAAKKTETVWLASDEDREGEAISWHLAEVLKLDPAKAQRIVFHEITKPAILSAIEHPRHIDLNLVDAQQARRVLDRLVGFKLSPVLWRRVRPSLSAGRVQSVAVRLIVEREREIEQFQSEAAYQVTALFELPARAGENPVQIKATLNRAFATESEAEDFLEACKKADFIVESVVKRPTKRTPAPPFTTSTLQQEAARKLGFPVAMTMRVAQTLYEAGLITYMRTDSMNLSDLCLNACGPVITEEMGADYHQRRHYHTHAKGAQEAHEAIRPTDMRREQIEGTPQEQRLYTLIRKRTLASQMADAQLEKTTVCVNVSGREEQFVTTGEVVLFDGFLRIYRESVDTEAENEGEGGLLPHIEEGEQLSRLEITARERYTRQPPRYTEASLVHKMEELGIGRPSTYAPTISTIQQREYVVKGDREGSPRQIHVLTLAQDNIVPSTLEERAGADKGKLLPTDIGTVVNDFLTANFPDIMDYNFTANVEKDFDDVAEGNKEWTSLIRQFYTDFDPLVTRAMEQRNEEDRRAIAEAKKLEREVEVAKKEQSKPLVYNLDSEDRRISGSFESNRGRLPMPITGGYRIVSHFGQYNVEGLKNVRLDNKGINILGSAGAKARSIFDGEVSAVFSMGGVTGVMVRHGSYISVYCNLTSVSVHRGQKVSARQVLGSVGQDNILQFQLRKERAKLNPESWLGR